jgi:Mn-dependent DtxR family transcriptional regulator
MTRDELFLIKLFELSQAAGDAFQEIDRYEVGKAIGQNDKSVDNIVRMLAQTNFVKKGEGNSIYLTQNGDSLVSDLRQNSK